MLLEAGKTLADVIEIFRDGFDGFPSGVQPAVPKKKQHRRKIYERCHSNMIEVIIKEDERRQGDLLCLNLLPVA